LVWHVGGFGPAMAAQAQYNHKTALQRILFAKNDLKTEFVVTVSPIRASLTIPYFKLCFRCAQISKSVADGD
jgi:hypothetical protein